jgi:hypothetical protein
MIGYPSKDPKRIKRQSIVFDDEYVVKIEEITIC